MTRLGCGVALVSVAASILSAQAPASQPASRLTAGSVAQVQPQPAHGRRTSTGPGGAAFQAPDTFQKYCFECHGGTKHRGDVSIERLIRQSAETSIGDYWEQWEKVAEMVETREMPPEDKAEIFPTDDERKATTTWIRASLRKYEAEHAGEPGRVTVRRLTSAEYAYALRDLTGDRKSVV